MSTESQGKDALEDFISEVGAPRHIISDNAQMERSKAWSDILRKYTISSSTTEPHHPHQNPAERRIQELKKGTNRILDRTGAPSYLWFYALLLWAGIMNVLSEQNHGGRTPTEAATGVTPDISPYIHFTFYQPVYYYDEAEKYPSTKEQLGYWLGPAEHCGDALTYWILTEDHHQVLARSTVRAADDITTVNRRRNNPFRDEGGYKALEASPDKELLSSGGDITHCDVLPTVEPMDLIGYKFVKEHDGTPQRAIVKELSEEDGKFLVEFVNGGEELMNYADLVNIFNKTDEDDDDKLWTYDKILDHRKVSGKMGSQGSLGHR